MGKGLIKKFVIVFCIFILTTSFSISNSDGVKIFSEPKPLNEQGADEFSFEMAVSGNHLYLLWYDIAEENGSEIDNNKKNHDIFFRASKDNGNTFESIINISKNEGTSVNQKIASSGKNVYVVWQDYTNGNNEIFFRKSGDYGKTFNEVINLSNNPGKSDLPNVFAIGNHVYVAWYDENDSTGGFHFIRSTDYGDSFENKIQLSNTKSTQCKVQIESIKNFVYLTWCASDLTHGEIFFRYSSDYGETFHEIVNISKNNGESYDPKIGVYGDNVYLLWRDHTPKNSDIFFRASYDNGQTFDETRNLSKNNGMSFRAKLSVIEDNVFVVWSDNTFMNNEILFTRSSDGGKTFHKVSNISLNPGSSYRPQISSTNEGVYVLWVDGTPGNYDAFLMKSEDNGKSCNLMVNLSQNKGGAYAHRIETIGNFVYVGWYDGTPGENELFFRVSSDGAHNFGDIINVNGDDEFLENPVGTFGYIFHPQIKAYQRNVHTVWSDDFQGNYEIIYSNSKDDGESFPNRINLSNTNGHSQRPEIAILKNNVYVAWEDHFSKNSEIFFKSSNDNGKNFADLRNLSNNKGNSLLPKINTLENNVYVVWADESLGNIDILFRSSSDYGKNFDELINLSNNEGRSKQPIVHSDGSDVYIVWHDNTIGNYEILFRHSNDYGKTFGNIINLSNDDIDSTVPMIDVVGENIYVTWDSRTSEKSQIYFTKSLDSGASFTPIVVLSNDSVQATNSKLSTNSNNVYVTWVEETATNSEIFFTTSKDNGATFIEPINLSNTSGPSKNPSIDSLDNSVFIIWRDGTPRNWELFSKLSSDQGLNFSETINLSNNRGGSYQQEMAISENDIFVVWQDNSVGQYSTLFSKVALNLDKSEDDFLQKIFRILNRITSEL